MTPPHTSKPLLTVLRWQALATLVIAAAAAILAGWPGALSAALGGGVSLVAGAGFAAVLRVSLGDGRPRGVGPPMLAMFRAEAVKIVLIVAGLWLVLSTYRDIVLAAFFAAFVVTVIVFSMAIFVRD